MHSNKLIKRYSIFIFLVIGFSNLFAQNVPPPKAGKYVCGILSSQITTMPGIKTSIVTGETKMKIGSDLVVTVSKAPFDIVLKGDGSYSVTNIKSDGGTYIYTPQTKKIIFTGDLTLFIFKAYTFVKNTHILQLETKNGVQWQCELGNQLETSSNTNNTSNTIENKKLNKDLTGTITVTVSNQSNNFLGKVFEFNLAKGTYNQLFDNGVVNRNPAGEIIYVDSTSRISINDKSGKTVQQLTTKTNYGNLEIFPAISNDGKYLAFTVKSYPKTNSMSQLVSDGLKTIITDRKLQQISEFKGYTQAAWMPDGSIIVSGSRSIIDSNGEQGLFIIDKSFKNVRRLTDGFKGAKMPTVSPDGKKIAFVFNGEIWTLDLITNITKKVVYGSETSFPVWLPNSRFFALNAIDPTTKRWLVYINDVEKDEGFWLKDAKGNFVESWNRITWMP
jgi:Tol biopolymer transport system component